MHLTRNPFPAQLPVGLDHVRYMCGCHCWCKFGAGQMLSVCVAVSFNSTRVRRYIDVENCDAAAEMMSAGAAKYLRKFRGSKKLLIPLPHADGS